MPPMTWLGWFHTIMGAIAILTAAYTLYQNRIIRASDLLGRAYLLITLFVAGSASLSITRADSAWATGWPY